MTVRTSEQHRTTKETTIDLVLDVDGSGSASASTGIPFFDHMLEQLGKHGGFDLRIEATGDLEVDTHHTVEDVGIVLGTALKQALGDKAGVRRFASSLVPLDEALVQVALDLSGRPFLVYEVDPVSEWIGTFDPQLAEEFWRSVRVRRRDHAAHHVAGGEERSSRDRSVVQGSRSRAARRGEGRGHGRAVDQGHPLTVPPTPSTGAAVPDLYPAIDLRGGHAVRLHQGDFDAETVYDDDPVRVAGEFEAAGAQWIHVVDLDAARTGTRTHLDQIRLMVRSVSCKIEVGGGVRTADAAAELLDAGVERVVVGTAAVERPALVEELCHEYPGRIAVGLDARGNEVAIKGWVEGSGADLVTLAQRFEGVGLAALIVTEIGRDGTLEGPAFGQLGSVLAACGIPLIASGGVGTLDDLRALAQLRSGDRGLEGIIVGRAIYEGRFDVAEALVSLAEAVAH